MSSDNMRFTKKIIVLFAVLSMISACGLVDDYILGKDNTPKPTPLKPLQSKINWLKHWSALVGKPSKTSAFLKLKPVVLNQVVYTANEHGLVQAIYAKDGKLIWSKQLQQGIVSGPEVKKNYLAIGTNDSKVMLLNRTNGELLWQVSVSGDVLSKPLIHDGLVLVKTIDGNVYAFNIQNGHTIWVVDHGSPGLILKASSSPVLRGNELLVGFSDGKLDAIDLKTGNVSWQRSIAFASGASDVERLVDIDADPIVLGDLIYVATYQGYIGAMSLKNAEFIWTKPASIYKNMAVDSHAIYVTDSQDVLWSFNRKNGQVLWKQRVLKARGLTEPVLLGHKLIVGDKMGVLHVLSTESGELLARTELGSSIDIAPTVSNDKVYVMTRDGQLHQFIVKL